MKTEYLINLGYYVSGIVGILLVLGFFLKPVIFKLKKKNNPNVNIGSWKSLLKSFAMLAIILICIMLIYIGFVLTVKKI